MILMSDYLLVPITHWGPVSRLMHVLLNYEDLWKLRHKKDLKCSLVAIPQGPHYMQGFTLLSEFNMSNGIQNHFTGFNIAVLTQVKSLLPRKFLLDIIYIKWLGNYAYVYKLQTPS